jgi:cytidylate kinase
MVIAIDGPAGSGKSTIALMLAEGLNFIYINSGNVYRALTLGCIRNNITIMDTEAVLAYAKTASIDYRGSDVYLDNEHITGLLHTDEIDRLTAPLSAIVPVRHLVNDCIRRIARNGNAVVEGRDITTVVFPDAEYRFYLDASIEERARRRFEQGTSRLSLEEIRQSIAERDAVDQKKTEGNLKIAPGVCIIDTSLLTIQQVYDRLIHKITEVRTNHGTGGSGG